MAFTTNGNMHRHMRTHGLDLNDDMPVRGRGARASRDSGRKALKPRIEVDESSNLSDDSGHVKSTPSLERSPLSDRLDHHPAAQAMKNLMTSKFAFPGTTPAPSSHGLGFFDLSFTDFSSKKFPSIAQSFCEHNLRKSASPYHEYECVKCNRGFPSGSSLNLHESSVHSPTMCPLCRVDLGSPDSLIKHMLQHRLEGLGLRGDAVSSLFGANNPFTTSNANDKEGFMAMLQLHTRELQSLDMDKDRKGDNNSLSFDDPTYFVHAKPSPKINDKKTESEFDAIKTGDLADIQSIISLTKSGNHLKQMSAPSPSTSEDEDDNESVDVVANDKLKRNESASSNDGQDGSNTEEERSMANGSSKGSSSGSIAGNNNNELACKVCGVEFKNSSALKKHSRGHMQGGGHNYSCHLCTYTSLDKSTLVRHLRTHNGERPFQCVICKYAFTTKANCERHVRKRHKKFSKTEIKASMQFNTELLASSSASIDSLNLNNSNLSLVGNRRNREEAAMRHQQQEDDTTDSDFPNSNDTVCKYCKVDFKFNRVLKHHLRSLNNSCNRKPFICSVCTVGFSTKNNCLRHVLRQHSQVDGDKAISCIIFNGKAMNASSYSEEFSDEEGSSSPPSHGSKNGSLNSPTSKTCSLLRPPVDSLSNLKHLSNVNINYDKDDRNSSLAALCSVGASNPLNLTKSENGDAYDGGDEFDENNNDDQPFDLSRKTPGRTGRGQPLDLAAHALDLSCKQGNTPPPAHISPHISPHKSNASHEKQPSPSSSDDLGSLSSDLSARSAASALLAMQSAFPQTSTPTAAFPFLPGLPHSMAAAFAQHPMLYQVQQAALNGIHPGLVHPSNAAASAVVDNLLKMSAAFGLNPSLTGQIQNTSTRPSLSPSPMGMASKNERQFTCKYCSAGFTLKSNMERHIKRKHPLFARGSRSVRSASCGSSGPKDDSPVEGSPDVAPVNQQQSTVS